MAHPDPSDDAPQARVARSLSRNSLAQFLADGSLYASALATSVITARWLGPSDKGALSVLLFIAHAVLFWIASFGARDAVVVLVARGRVSASQALSVLLVPLTLSGTAGGLVLWLISYPADWEGIRGAVVLAAVGLLLIIHADTAEAALNADERLVETNLVRGSVALLTTVLTACFVIWFDGGIAGAVGAVAVAQALRLMGVARLIVRTTPFTIRPVWDMDLGRDFLRVGLPTAASYVLIILSQRMDQLIVYVIAGEAPAGVYAVALTIGQLVGYLAVAVSASSFPRIARLPTREAWDLGFRVARIGLIGTVITTIALSILVPLVTRPLFGDEFVGAVAPAVLLLAGGILWSQQWILARAAVARGHTRVLAVSFCTNIAIMVGLDAVLVPQLGIFGAAIASVSGALCGLAVCLRWYRRQVPGYSFSCLLPRLADVRETIEVLRRLLPVRQGS